MGRPVEIAAEELEVGDQQSKEGGNDAKLPQEYELGAVALLFSALGFVSQGVENGFLSGGDALTAVDDALAAQHQSRTARDAGEEFGFSLLALDAVENKVGADVLMELQSRHEFARIVLVAHDVLVGAAGREEGAHIARDGIGAVDHAHAAGAGGREMIHRIAADNTGGIDLLQRAHGVLHVGVGDAGKLSRSAVGCEVVHLLTGGGFVEIIVGIEGAQGAVALAGQLFGRFGDGKFEIGDERRIVPGLPHFVFVAEFGVARQGEQQTGDADGTNEQEIEPMVDVEFELHGHFEMGVWSKCTNKSR